MGKKSARAVTAKARSVGMAPARHLHGWRWLNNDVVNSGSSIVGSLMAGFLGWLVS